jgi:hypothetical protein
MATAVIAPKNDLFTTVKPEPLLLLSHPKQGKACMQTAQSKGGKLLRVSGEKPEGTKCRETRRQAITARLLALPRLLAHAY